MTYSRKLICIPLFLFCFSLRIWGMENVFETIPQQKSDLIDSPMTCPRKSMESINSCLTVITQILEKNLETDSHFFILPKDSKKTHLCKLSNLTSDLISGKSNKPLRDNLRSLLYKPSIDPYYTQNLNRQDFSILEILRNSINAENPIYDIIFNISFMETDLKKLNSAIDRILSFKTVVHKKDSVNPEMMGRSAQQLFLRQSIDEVNNILSKTLENDAPGLAKLSSLNTLRIWDFAQDEITRIRETLSKPYIMFPFNAADLANLLRLKNAIFGKNGSRALFDTYTKTKLEGVFDDLICVLKFYVNNPLSAHEKIGELLSVSDIRLVESCLNYQGFLDLEVDVKGAFKTILSDLNQMLKGDYLNYLPFYCERESWRLNHLRVLNSMGADNLSVDVLVDLFTEICQLKMALSGLSNARYTSTWTVLARDPNHVEGIHWIEGFKKVGGLKEALENIQSSLLFQMSDQIKVAELHEALELKKNNNERKIQELNQKKSIWILSLDGGGIRGKIAAEILLDITRQLAVTDKKTILDKFDFFAGTSVGGLIALSLTTPKEGDQPAFDAEFIANLMEKEKASIIFPQMDDGKKKRAQANSYAYDPLSMESLLMANFEFRKLSDMIKPTMLMAHSKYDQRFFGLKSWDPHAEAIYSRDAGRATSSASTYFPPQTVWYDDMLIELVDGGITANNPLREALREVLELRQREGSVPLEQINILSIGTGIVHIKTPHSQGKTGILGLVDDLTEGSMNENSRLIHELGNKDLETLNRNGIKVTHYRFNPGLDKSIELDKSDDETIGEVRTVVHEKIFNSTSYGELISDLVNGFNKNTENYCVQISGKDINGVNQDKMIDLTGKRPNLPKEGKIIVKIDEQ